MNKLLIKLCAALLIVCCSSVFLNGCDLITHITEGHIWEIQETKDATCKETGYVMSKCRVCDATKQDTLPIVDHIPLDEVRSDENTHWYKCAYCNSDVVEQHEYILTNTSDIKHEYTCTICNVSFREDHVLGIWVGFGEDENNLEGLKNECKICGEVFIEYLENADPICEHEFGDTFITLLDPTCAKEGWAAYPCKKCGEPYMKVLPPTGEHSFNADGVCTTCGHSIEE